MVDLWVLTDMYQIEGFHEKGRDGIYARRMMCHGYLKKLRT